MGLATCGIRKSTLDRTESCMVCSLILRLSFLELVLTLGWPRNYVTRWEQVRGDFDDLACNSRRRDCKEDFFESQNNRLIELIELEETLKGQEWQSSNSKKLSLVIGMYKIEAFPWRDWGQGQELGLPLSSLCAPLQQSKIKDEQALVWIFCSPEHLWDSHKLQKEEKDLK